ncbi:TauD/TfdA family dioxygenase [Streptomyces violascens]|uniref:TauD/TfdA-like domain-containing protein n=1 Tax=Streptomyces violascens TaxID=67381 RepID=A0ABQ3QTF2_9ACTN|nr:TauD/TfdA family dioxygenase [Streptomyces violascens]GHI40548.1 hypothetical protein Sviol_49560 [Streptomyces violascens]
MFIDIPSELEAALIDLPLPTWELDGSFLAQSTMDRYRTELTATPQFEETATTLRHALTDEGGGHAVLRLGNLAKALGIGDDRFLQLVNGFAVEVAVPFSPFPRWHLWKDIGVKVDKDPGKSSGIGYNAFHMDLVNASLPPDYTTLLCLRPDPLGGGPSILSDAHAAVARLSEDGRALLAESAYRYGTFFDLFGVGEEYKPFPILDGSPGEGFVRFTAKMLERSPLGRAHADAAKKLAEELVRGQVSFMLQPGDYLIVNQRRFLHGREALHRGQETVLVADRRLLLQLFLRGGGRRRLGPHSRPTAPVTRRVPSPGPAEAEDRFVSTVFLGSGLVFVATLFVAAAAAGTVLSAHQPQDFGRHFAHELLTTYGMRMAAVFVFATSTIGRRLGSFPRGLSLAGVVAGLVLLVVRSSVPWSALVFPAWALLISVYILWAARRAP